MPGMPGMGGMGGEGMVDEEEDDDDDLGGFGAMPGREVDNGRLYALLGIEKDASPAEVKKAYHRSAMKHHPDKGGDPEKFKDVQLAFEVLSDPDKREKYDAMGEEGLNDDSPGPQDIFAQMFGGKGSGKGRGRQRPRTKDQVKPMWVTLEELYTGVTRKLPITRKVLVAGSEEEKCDACDGQGTVVQVIRMGPLMQQIQSACPRCGGAGSSAKTKTEREVLEVFVEKGSPDGHKITFHGKADEASGCEPGDVVVVIKLQEHPRFMRKGADLYLERSVSLADALTGFRIVVQHLDGRKWVVRSAPGEVLQPTRGGVAIKAVKSGGMPIHQDPFNYGNLFLVLSIQFPTSLEPALAAELRQLLGAGGDDDEDVGEGGGEDVEHATVCDIDPLESAQQSKKVGGEAYEEDEAHGRGGVPCQQQ